MKKINYLVKIFVVVVVAGIMASCMKADNSFGFARGGGYIVQEYDGETPRFYPYISFEVGNGSLKSGSVTKDDVVYDGNVVENIFFETAPLYSSSLKDVNGSYKLNAVSTENKTATATISLNAETDKRLGRMEVIDFYYSGNALVLKIKDVANANSFGFMLKYPSDYYLPEYSRASCAIWATNKNDINVLYSDGVYTVSYGYDSNEIGTDYVTVYPVAMYDSPTGSVVMNGSSKILYKGSTSMY